MIRRWLALTYYLYALRLAALSHFYFNRLYKRRGAGCYTRSNAKSTNSRRTSLPLLLTAQSRLRCSKMQCVGWATCLPTIVRSQYFGGQASCPPYGLAFQAALAVNIDCLRHRGKQIAFECEFFAGVVKFAVFYQKAVFGAVGEGGDFGVEQADVVLGEDFGEVGEQVGAVGGDDLDGVAVGCFFGLDADAGGEW